MAQNTKDNVNRNTSTASSRTFGTAQGSILGPLIFILYVNDMFKSVEIPGDLFMYADDTLIMCKADNIKDVMDKCTESLTKISVWCEANKLSMNYNKTKYMIGIRNRRSYEIRCRKSKHRTSSLL